MSGVMDDPVVRVGGTNKSHGGNVMDKYLKESRDFWRDRALFLAREAVKDEERHGRALAAREAEIAKLRPIVEVVASLNLSDIGSMKASDILYWHGGKLTVAHVRAAVAALDLPHQDGSNVV